MLPEVYVMPLVILKAPYGIFDEMDFADIKVIICADVFNPTGIKVFRMKKNLCASVTSGFPGIEDCRCQGAGCTRRRTCQGRSPYIKYREHGVNC